LGRGSNTEIRGKRDRAREGYDPLEGVTIKDDPCSAGDGFAEGEKNYAFRPKGQCGREVGRGSPDAAAEGGGRKRVDVQRRPGTVSRRMTETRSHTRQKHHGV